MKKVLIGICGIGNGHINRQSCVIEELLNKNYTVLVAISKDKFNLFHDKFPNLGLIDIDIPWIVCDSNGVNFEKTIEKFDNVDYFSSFLEFGNKVEYYFKGKPDLVISDYEPNVAQYSYAKNVPLITMEQQSKYIYLEELDFENFSIQEEICRLNYFFPKFDKKIISSFFPLNINDNKIVQVAPIINNIPKKKVIKNLILVYFSPYSNSSNYEKVLNIVSQISDFDFKIYSNNTEVYKKNFPFSNLIFLDFSNKFKDDLSCCSGLITTGGHQLISESISLFVPLYVIPLDTYEQHYNGYMVKKYNLGLCEDISLDSIKSFIFNILKYKENIIAFKNTYYKFSWKDKFFETINSVFENKENR